jgi:hypothetical protein
MVSIIITFILMIVISITVLGFAQVIRRSERQALDAQLSTQAFYAAESGVNEATYILRQATTDVVKTACDGQLDGKDVHYDIDSATDTKVTCLLVQSELPTLVYQLSPTTSSRVIPLRAADSADTLSEIHLKWYPTTSEAASGCSAAENKAVASWNCPYSVIRVDLIPENAITNNASGDRKALLGQMFTGFIYPTNGGGNVDFTVANDNLYGGKANQGAKANAKCDATSCQITIRGLPAGNNAFYMRVSALYRSASLDISADDNLGGSSKLSEAQVLIDSTGKAQDVLQRVQVRVPVAGSVTIPDYALQSALSLCKTFTTSKDTDGNPVAYNNICI